MISKILATAVKLWLRSQIEIVEELELDIASGDRQLLSGYIPLVSLASSRAVYQGLHLRHVRLNGSNIRINLTEILKGKALKLLEPVPITGKLIIEEVDLNASLSSPLLISGLTDLLCQILAKNGIDHPRHKLADYFFYWQDISLGSEKLVIKGTIRDNDNNINPLSIYSGISLANSHTVEFFPLQIEGLPELLTLKSDRLLMDLGSEVAIEQINLVQAKLMFVGSLTIMP